ncbi:MAG: RNase H-like domain-containing protein, partial [Gaiellaceae bacterium]
MTADASNIATGAVLTQDAGGGQQPVAFMSTKLRDAQLNYTTLDKEFLAIVAALEEWRSYLQGHKFTLRTDHRNLLSVEHAAVQQKPRLMRWIHTLQQFDFQIEHVAGTANPADPLSRRPDYQLNVLQAEFTEERLIAALRQAYQFAPPGPERGATQGRDGLWRTERGQLIIPDVPELRRFLLSEYHVTGGHFGVAKTLELLSRHLYWRGMEEDVKRVCGHCYQCQQFKSHREGAQGLLQPLPTPGRPWKEIAMDFITHLPPSGESGFDCIFVVVDRLSRMAHFVPTHSTLTAAQFGAMFQREVVRYHG